MTARRHDLPALGLDAVRLLGAGAIAFGVEGLFESNRMLALMVGALAVDWLAGRAGLKWDETDKARWQQLGATLGKGAAIGGAIALVSVLVLAALRKANLGVGEPAPVGLGIGVLTALVQAARDELLYRGMPLALMKDRVSDRFALPFTALLGAAPLLLSSHATPAGVVVVLLSGFAFALLWRLGKGMYLPWGAHAAWLFFSGTGVRGMLLDVRFSDGQLLPAASASGAAAWVAIAVIGLAIAALLAWIRRVPRD